MEINNELITQWEPKIQKMVSGIFVVGMERDAIDQELRIGIMKAAKAYDESRGILFHTYLHTALVNTIRTLISKAQRQPEVRSLDTTIDDITFVPLEVANALVDPHEYEQEVDTNELVEAQNLDIKERLFLQLKLAGLTMEEITEDLKACKKCIYCVGHINGVSTYVLDEITYVAYDEKFPKYASMERNYAKCLHKNGESAYKVRQALRAKFSVLANDYEYD